MRVRTRPTGSQRRKHVEPRLVANYPQRLSGVPLLSPQHTPPYVLTSLLIFTFTPPATLPPPLNFSPPLAPHPSSFKLLGGVQSGSSLEVQSFPSSVSSLAMNDLSRHKAGERVVYISESIDPASLATTRETRQGKMKAGGGTCAGEAGE